MNPDERRRELGRLLRSRRGSLRPEDIGLLSSPRRRAQGLRREDVAAASDISLSWYAWLEQGREIHPSAGALGRICETLRLTEVEREYVALLANRASRALSSQPGGDTSAQLNMVQRILDAFGETPAMLYNLRFDVMATNASARTIYGADVASCSSWRRNMIWRFFMDPGRRKLYPDATDDLAIRNLIQALRLNWARNSSDEMVGELIAELSAASREFEDIWERHEVARLSIVAGRLLPDQSAEPLRIQYSRLCLPTLPGYAIGAEIPSTAEDVAMLHRLLVRRA
jgi:transcriptional regulator with XRE-family HTH domain